MPITIDDFQKVDMRVGRVLEVQDFPEARKPSYKFVIDFGELGIKKSAAAVQPWYKKEELVRREVVAVVNFPPRRIAGFDSEVLILGAEGPEGRIILLQPDAEAPLAARIL
ncbi:MAG: tRNA-binding protein [Chloroflexi bacterium]|nr:tRNA-binding protein [Chloroflexota bacterium]